MYRFDWQVALSENNGIKYLIGLMASPKEGVDLLRVEAALTLATATLGESLVIIHQ